MAIFFDIILAFIFAFSVLGAVYTFINLPELLFRHRKAEKRENYKQFLVEAIKKSSKNHDTYFSQRKVNRLVFLRDRLFDSVTDNRLPINSFLQFLDDETLANYFYPITIELKSGYVYLSRFDPFTSKILLALKRRKHPKLKIG